MNKLGKNCLNGGEGQGSRLRTHANAALQKLYYKYLYINRSPVHPIRNPRQVWQEWCELVSAIYISLDPDMNSYSGNRFRGSRGTDCNPGDTHD